MSNDPIRDKIFSIIRKADHPLTLTEIYMLLHNKSITKNMIAARLVQLNILGKVDRGTVFRNEKLVRVYRARKGVKE